MENSALQSDRHEPGAASADEEVSVPLDTQTKRAFRVFVGLIVIVVYGLFWRFGLRGSWGQWSMRTQMAAAIIPAFSSRIPRISTGSVSSGDGCSIRANSVRWLN